MRASNMYRSRKIRRALMRKLLKKMQVMQEQRPDNYVQYKGVLKTHLYQARVDIFFKSHDFFETPPIIRSSEAWLKDDADWHYQRDSKGTGGGELCWIIPEEWAKIHSLYNKPLETAINEAASLIINNTTNLLNKHWAGYELGLTEWQPEWDQWKHYQAGQDEFHEEILKHGKPTHWKN